MANSTLDNLRDRILSETKNVSAFVIIGETLYKLYYEDKLVKNQKEFLNWTKANLGFSKSTTYEYIISYKVYSHIASKIPENIRPPMYQSHCQLLAKVPDDQLVETWINATNQAPNGIVTTGFLESFLIGQNVLKKTPVKKERVRRKRKRSFSSSDEDDEENSPIMKTPEIKTSPVPTPLTPQPPDVLAAAADIMDMMERTPPKNRQRTRPQMLVKELIANEDPSQPHVLTNEFDSPGRALNVTPSLISPQKTFRTRLVSHTPKDSNLPFDESILFELGKGLCFGDGFDFVAHSVDDFLLIEQQQWYGSIYCNLAECLPYSTCLSKDIEKYGGIERLLQVIFTRFAKKQYAEGLFLIRGEFGADWFTPILQHPFVILRHLPSLSPEPSEIANFNSYVLFYMGPNPKDFATIYRPVGLLPGVNSWASFAASSSLDDRPRNENIAASALCEMITLDE